ncbi:MAG: hypothetical protein ACXAB4_06650 [Candidatus Hodarchaeales archaeon]|jgi:heme-degrading monooxygenase HmoA
MYARVISIPGKPDALEEAKKIVEENIISALRERKGWKGFSFFFNEEIDKAMIISWWATKEDALSVVKDGFMKENLSKAAHLFAGEPQIELFEVILMDKIGHL